ncbi:MAG: carbohydrate kinase, partial [Spirochaetaceae bacterium]
MYDILMVGHVSKDIIEDPHGVQHVLGGPVVYCSAAAARSGASVLVVTKAATEDRERLSIITESGAELRTLDTTATTSIHNRYHDADHERRTVTLLQAADPFTIDDIPADEARIIHFAGLFAGDLPQELVERLAPRGEIALDAQGVVRKNEAGNLVFGDWERKERFLPSITYFKTDAAEAEALT